MAAMTKDQKRELMDEISEHMAKSSLTLKVVNALADKYGITSKTVYTYRKKVLQAIKDQRSSMGPDDIAAAFHERVRQGLQSSLAAGDHKAYAAILKVEASAVGLHKTTVEHAGEVSIRELEALRAIPEEDLLAELESIDEALAD